MQGVAAIRSDQLVGMALFSAAVVPLNEVREPFIGSVTSDGKTIRPVETDDENLMSCQRTGPDEIELTYMEAAPHRVVYSTILHRKK